MDANLYASPTANLEDASSDEKLEQLRKTYINHEASVKSIGSLYMLGALFLGLVGIGSLFAEQTSIGFNTFFVAIASLYAWLGISVHKLKKGSKVPVGILSVLGLLAFPIGTIINAYILYLVFSAKGQIVFSDQYKEAIVATPDIKHKTSLLLKFFMVLLLLIFVFAIFVSVMG